MISFDLARAVPADADLVVEGVARGAVPDDPVLAAAGFDGATGQAVLLPGRVVVGLGEVGRDGPNGRALRTAAAVAARTAARCERVATTLPATEAVAEGFVLGAYRFTKYRSDPKPNRLATVTVVGGGGQRARAALDRGARVGRAVCVARDLVNEPGGTLTAPELADRAREVARSSGLKARVLRENAIARAGLSGLLAVNRGSTIPPRWVELTYEPESETRVTVALVGKGITFDSGGLSIKTSEGMSWMKADMGGAAAIVGALSAARDLGVRVRARAFLPMTDNMLGGDAQRVGDVIRYRNGTTVEVMNTDAEGRLILADGLVAASQEKPVAIVDVATLTGACMVALGPKVAGLFSNHDGFAAQVEEAAAVAGEPVWRLPLVERYAKDLESKVADLKNVGGRYGGAIVAALFLRRFVGDGIPWAHLDIAGPAYGDDDDGELSAGGTGFGVRTILELLRTFKRP